MPESEAQSLPESKGRPVAEAKARVVTETDARVVYDVPAKMLRPHVVAAEVPMLGLGGGRREHHQSCQGKR